MVNALKIQQTYRSFTRCSEILTAKDGLLMDFHWQNVESTSMHVWYMWNPFLHITHILYIAAILFLSHDHMGMCVNTSIYNFTFRSVTFPLIFNLYLAFLVTRAVQGSNIIFRAWHHGLFVFYFHKLYVIKISMKHSINPLMILDGLFYHRISQIHLYTASFQSVLIDHGE